MARVLIADDELLIRRTLRALLERDGHRVSTADNAHEAMQQLATGDFNVVVADIIMPGMDGLQLLAEVQARSPEIEVVLITGAPDVDTAVAALRRGAFDYLAKPLTGERVCRVVARAAEANALKTDNRRLAEENRRHTEQLEEIVRQRTTELSESEERFRRVFESGPLGMALVALDMKVVTINETLARIIGYDADKVVSRPFQDFVAAQFGEVAWPGPDADDASIDPSLQVEKPLRRKDGEIVWCRVTGRAIRDQAGHGKYGLFVVEDVTDQKRATEQLQTYQEELRGLATRLALAEERERRRIAIDLHDVAAQNLALAMLKLRTMARQSKDETEASRLDEVHGLVESTAHGLRSLSRTLSPPMLYELGLEAALETLAKRFEEERQITCHFDDDGQNKPLTEEAMTTAYRCVCELLANTAKHAEAQVASISIRRNGAHAQIVVRDDGRGFETAGPDSDSVPPEGFGLFSIRERVRALRGEVSIKTRPGGGTCTELRIPLRRGRSCVTNEGT